MATRNRKKALEEDPTSRTGNLLNWTLGSSKAAYLSRYRQVCSLKASKLSVPEVNEAIAVLIHMLQPPGIELLEINGKKKLRIEVIALELKQQVTRLAAEERDADMAARAAQASLPESSKADAGLAGELAAAISSARDKTCGFVYLKQWSLKDGTRWYKVGITNNPDRRDAEQNVLPVPSVTLKLIQAHSMDQAAAIERSIHKVLDAQRIRNANNRELFHLSDAQLAALMLAMAD